MIKDSTLKKLYNSNKATCCKCRCALQTTPGFPIGSVFVLDLDGNFYCMGCDAEFEDGDERIFDEDLYAE